MATGTFAARVYTSKNLLPIEGAKVTILSKEGDLIAFRLTNEDGLTDTVDLEAPDAASSLTPESDGAAFAVYDLRLDHPNYYVEFIEDVQIFAGIKSWEEFALVPLEEFASPRSQVRVHQVVPQNL